MDGWGSNVLAVPALSSRLLQGIRSAPQQTRQTRQTTNKARVDIPHHLEFDTNWDFVIMDPPNMDALDLSDSDSDALFDTPAARKSTKKSHDTGDGAQSATARAKESHYTTEEAREAALGRELESIRNVNKVIEGVVESLQKAKDNMEVGHLNYSTCSLLILY